MLGKPGRNRWGLEAVEKEQSVSYLSSYEDFFSAAGGRRHLKLDRKAGSGIVKGSISFLFQQ